MIATQGVSEEKSNESSKTISHESKTQLNPEAETEEKRTYRRRYRRPHIERVWIMRSLIDNGTEFRQNYSDPIRSFATAIRDPQKFVRYLRDEEMQELKKYGRLNLTSSNKKLPNSRYVQMEIYSHAQNHKKIPILNMIVEQDEGDKMDSNSFMELMEQVASIPWNVNSTGEVSFDSNFKNQQELTWIRQVEGSDGQKLQQYKEHHKFTENQSNEGNSNSINNEELRRSDSVTQQIRTEERKTRRRHRGRNFHQRVRMSEPLLFVGEFGMRTPNYTRPSVREFNRSKSHDILMAPSQYLLPPAESNFRHFNLPQNFLSFSQTPIPTPRDRYSLRRRKRPRVSQARHSVEVLTTETSKDASSIFPDISHPTRDISLVSTDTPRISTDVHQQAVNYSPSDADASLVHVDLPRIYTDISRSNSFPTPSTTIQPPPIFSPYTIEVSSTEPPISSHSPLSTTIQPPFNFSPYSIDISTTEQPLNYHSSSEPILPSNITPNDENGSLNVSSTNNNHNVEFLQKSSTSSQHSIDISQPNDDFVKLGEVAPPSRHIVPPLPPSFIDDSIPYNLVRVPPSQASQEQHNQIDILITASPNYNHFPNDVPAERPNNVDRTNQEQPALDNNVSNQQHSLDFEKHNNNNNNNNNNNVDYSSLMAPIANMFGQKDHTSSNLENISGQRRQFSNQEHKRVRQYSRHHQEDEYDELQLTAAETTYYRNRQLKRRPFIILETAEETGSIPGVPGRDYPIYNRPPKTNFACIKGHGGYFADISTRCQVFFVCSDDGRGEPMLCPNGTLFNQDFLVCDWWFNVACEGIS